jgi:hypothetical protein
MDYLLYVPKKALLDTREFEARNTDAMQALFAQLVHEKPWPHKFSGTSIEKCFLLYLLHIYTKSCTFLTAIEKFKGSTFATWVDEVLSRPTTPSTNG